MMRLFLISLGVTCLASVILFLYFRNRVGRMEQKVDLMFQLIQEYEQTKNIAATRTFPAPTSSRDNEVQMGGNTEHDDLISVSDDDDHETDSEEISDNEVLSLLISLVKQNQIHSNPFLSIEVN